jgi:hypothetical protein
MFLDILLFDNVVVLLLSKRKLDNNLVKVKRRSRLSAETKRFFAISSVCGVVVWTQRGPFPVSQRVAWKNVPVPYFADVPES